MQTYINCQIAVVLICCAAFFPLPSSAGQTHECRIEKRREENTCVFYNVVYTEKTTGVTFKAPVGKVQHVEFTSSSLEHLPKEFLSAFPNLQSLVVADANLSSVVIPAKLERLDASNNRISRVIVHQTRDSTTMTELMLDSNQLQDISNLTRLAKLGILSLNGNKNLPLSDTIDLGRFQGMDNLNHLLLSDIGALYLENERDVALPALQLLDISNNNLVTMSLRVAVLKPMKSLQYLRLAHNQLEELDVTGLVENNPELKEVLIEGNHFRCDIQRKMLAYLHKANITTPVNNKRARCLLGFEKEDDMCCRPVMGGTSVDNMPRTPPVVPPVGPPVAPEEDTFQMTNSGTVQTTSTSTTTSTERSTSTVQSVAKSNDGKNVGSTVTLGNSVLTSLTVVALAVVKLMRY